MIKITHIFKQQFSKKVCREVEVLQVPYSILTSGSDDALEAIDRAYSEKGLGTLAIRGVPGFAEKRKQTLL